MISATNRVLVTFFLRRTGCWSLFFAMNRVLVAVFSNELAVRRCFQRRTRCSSLISLQKFFNAFHTIFLSLSSPTFPSLSSPRSSPSESRLQRGTLSLSRSGGFAAGSGRGKGSAPPPGCFQQWGRHWRCRSASPR